VIAATTYYSINSSIFIQENHDPEVQALDLTCGFTDDFANFIKANGIS